MTRHLFKDWAVYLVKQLDREGMGKRHHGNPQILLLDDHTSRWTYDDLVTLMQAGIYPFFIVSHTSA